MRIAKRGIQHLRCMVTALIFAQSCAYAQVNASSTKSDGEIWMPAIAALIGGLLSGVIGPLIKDFLIQRLNDKRTDKKMRDKIEESYLAPLSAISEKLIWRMSEMIIKKRTHFLMIKAHPIA